MISTYILDDIDTGKPRGGGHSVKQDEGDVLAWYRGGVLAQLAGGPLPALKQKIFTILSKNICHLTCCSPRAAPTTVVIPSLSSSCCMLLLESDLPCLSCSCNLKMFIYNPHYSNWSNYRVSLPKTAINRINVALKRVRISGQGKEGERKSNGQIRGQTDEGVRWITRTFFIQSL